MVAGLGDWIVRSRERLEFLLAEVVEAAISIVVSAIGLIAFGVLIATIGPAVLVALAGAPLWAVVMVLLAL